MNYDQLWGFLAGNATMLGVVSVVLPTQQSEKRYFPQP
jgi:hypothetical protein